MTANQGITRRHFLRGALGASSVALLAACAPGTPAPAATTAAKPPAAGATPGAAAKPDEQKIGRSLIGQLQGPTIVTDASQYPKTFKEAPMLAELVKAGKLPPVEKRLPDPSDVLVIKPVNEVGKYGGTWRRAFTGPADGENGNRISSTDKPLFWDHTGTKIAPSVAKDWKLSDDGKTTTLILRKGMKWSDGAPFTANDFVYWYEDVYKNKDLIPSGTSELSINGKEGKFEKVDDVTVRWVFPDPYYLFVDVLAGSTQVGGGLATRGDVCMGAYAPAHYMKQFHPKYTDPAKVDQMAKDAKFDNWVNLYKFKNTWRLNPDLPMLSPWKTSSPINTPQWVLERNPFYWEVDPEGNQLPYLDKIVMQLAENLEVFNLRAIAGEIDAQARHIDIGKLPVLLENRQKGDYSIRLDPGDYGADTALQVNQSYDADPEIAKWLTNRDFRRALALGIDRDQMNETFWLGVGIPGSCVVAETSPYSPGPEYRKLWSVLDVKQSNELLDKAGLDKKDSEGYRQRTDGKGRLRIELTSVGAQFLPWTQHAEMIKEHWKKIGIQADVVENERSLMYRRAEANETQIILWMNDGSDEGFLFPHHWIPAHYQSFMGPLFGKWYVSGGKLGKEPKDPQVKKVLELFDKASGQPKEERIKTGKEIWKIVVEEQWTIGTVGLSPASMGVRVVKNGLGNIPTRHVNGQHVRTEGISHPATFYWKK